jgi:type IV secretion system protein VirD4
MDMDLHLARVQQRWRYAPAELPPGENLTLEVLAPDPRLLPATFEGPPDATADTLLDFFSQHRAASAPASAHEGGAIEPADPAPDPEDDPETEADEPNHLANPPPPHPATKGELS